MAFSGAIIDLDGVLYLGSTPIQGAPAAIRTLRSAGIKVRFLTNNSTLTRVAAAKRLSSMGMPAEEGDILASAYGAARYIKEKGGRSALVLGEDGLREELVNAGIEAIQAGRGQSSGFQYTVVGLDRMADYGKMVDAMRCILDGSKFVATNEDATFPTEMGDYPGAGVLVSAISTAVGRKPDVVIGKPNPYLFEFALEDMGLKPEEVVVVGDRIDTDIVGGKRVGAKTCLVLTGVKKNPNLESLEGESKPDFILKSISEIEKIIGAL
ncbi:MAG: HAD-IIA family hydrolase [Candidatus Micrarchaeota archaeon]|nr:HAD-IIA family hydrolase [Candidatus Micrarchaeota archaeon]